MKDALEIAKKSSLENLEAIRVSLAVCQEEGMFRSDDSLYNQVLGLMDEVEISTTWDEIEELVAQAIKLENDIANWHSRHGRTSYSLSWPTKPKN